MHGGAFIFKISVPLGSRLEYQRHNKREHNRGGYACAGGGQTSRYRIKEALLRPLYRAVCKQVAEARNWYGRARSRKIDEGLIYADCSQHYARKHKVDENFARRQIGEVDDNLRYGADCASH